jgi:hypothetical protein
MAGMHETARAGRTPAQTVAIVIAVVFLLVGVLGFIPGITTEFDSMTFAGHHSDALLLGVFAVSILHNIVHLLFGIVGAVMARTASGAVAFLIGGGIIYLGLWVYGILIDQETTANFVPVNTADNWLHLVLGAVMVGLGMMFSSQRTRS